MLQTAIPPSIFSKLLRRMNEHTYDRPLHHPHFDLLINQLFGDFLTGHIYSILGSPVSLRFAEEGDNVDKAFYEVLQSTLSPIGL